MNQNIINCTKNVTIGLGVYIQQINLFKHNFTRNELKFINPIYSSQYSNNKSSKNYSQLCLELNFTNNKNLLITANNIPHYHTFYDNEPPLNLELNAFKFIMKKRMKINSIDIKEYLINNKINHKLTFNLKNGLYTQIRFIDGCSDNLTDSVTFSIEI